MRLFEKRRNPEQNIRETQIDMLRRLASEAKKVTVSGHTFTNLFITFTDVEKLGINPTSSHTTTPNGIYAYPVDYILSLGSVSLGSGKFKNLPIPYAKEKPFVHVFEAVKPDALIVVGKDGEISEEDYELINDYYPDIEMRRSADSYSSNPDDSVFQSFVKSVFYNNGYDNLPDDDSNFTKGKHKSHQVASNMLRSIGFEGIVDLGSSVVHRFEPTQAVFFSKSAIRPVGFSHNGVVPPESENFTHARIKNRNNAKQIAIQRSGAIFDDAFLSGRLDEWYGNLKQQNPTEIESMFRRAGGRPSWTLGITTGLTVIEVSIKHLTRACQYLESHQHDELDGKMLEIAHARLEQFQHGQQVVRKVINLLRKHGLILGLKNELLLVKGKRIESNRILREHLIKELPELESLIQAQFQSVPLFLERNDWFEILVTQHILDKLTYLWVSKS